MFFPGMHVRYHDAPEQPWEYTWVTLQGRLVDAALRLAGITRESPLRRTSGNAAFTTMLERVVREVTGDDYGPLFSVAAAWGLVEALSADSMPSAAGADTLAEACAALVENQLGPTPTVHELAGRFGVDRSTLFRVFRERLGVPPSRWRTTSADSMPSAAGADTLAEACAALVENQLGPTPTVHELAGRFGVDRSTLFRVFRERLGVSPKEFIERSRFERARRLLRTTGLSVKEIALNCGFEDQCYFSAAFRRRFGVPPSRWRTTASAG
jgi:AraC-like DNA-binding protein